MMTSDKPDCPLTCDTVTVDVQPIIIISARRPRHVSATQNVGMEMVDTLTGVRAGVYDYPVATLETLQPGHFGRQRQDLAKGFRAGFRREGRNVLAGDHEDVDRRTSVQIAESHRSVVRSDYRRWYFAPRDAAEHAIR